MTVELLTELAKAKAMFQQRAIITVIENPASLCQAPCEAQASQGLDAQIASMSSHAAPVDAQDGGVEQCETCGDYDCDGGLPCISGDGI